jgi:tetratricopeptide (TPR) repeat protein
MGSLFATKPPPIMNESQIIETIKQYLAEMNLPTDKYDINVIGDNNIIIKDVENSSINITLNINGLTEDAIRKILLEKVKELIPKRLNDFSLYLPTEVIGREEEVKKVRAALETGNHTLIINGWGGVGKSTLLSYYMQQYETSYCHIFGHYGTGDLYAEEGEDKAPQKSMATALLNDRALHRQLHIYDEIAALLEAKAHEQALNLLNTTLQKLPAPVLWVIDNASASELKSIEQLQAKFPHFHLLISSRQVATNLPKLTLECLPEEDAVKLLYYYYDLNNEAPLSDAEKTTFYQDAAAIAALAGYHTLTLELIGGLLKSKKRFTFPTLRETLANKVIAYLKSPVKVYTPYQRGHNSPIDKAYLSHIIEQVFDLAELASNEDAKWLLRHFAVLPSSNIEGNVMEDLLNVNDINEENYFNGLDFLTETGWVRERNVPYLVYDCHSLIQEVVRKRLSPSTENCEMLWTKIDEIADSQDKITPKELKKWIPYLESVVEKLPLENETGVNLLHKIGGICNKTADYNLALRFEQKAIDICKYLWDDNHTLLANSYNNIAITYGKLGDHQTALSFNLKAIAIFEKVLDKNHPDLATSYGNIATIYNGLGDYQKSLSYALKAIIIREKTLDKNHPDLATSYTNITLTYNDLGDYQKSLSYALKAITIREKILDKNHPDLATSYGNIALTYNELGDYQKSLGYNLQGIAISEKVLDKNHPNFANYYNNIALTYEKLGDYQKSLDYNLQAMTICEKALGKSHPNLAISYHNIAITYASLKNWEKTIKYEQKAIIIRLKALPNGHPDIKTAVDKMKIYLPQAINEEGREKYEEVIQWFNRECGE